MSPIALLRGHRWVGSIRRRWGAAWSEAWVATRRGALVGRALPVTVALVVASCLQIDGGAVEVGWVLRDTRQEKVNCDAPALRAAGIRIDRIRVQVRLVAPDGTSGDDLCASGAIRGCEFQCENGNGVTPFSIPVPDPDPGDGVQVESREYLFSLLPLSQDGTPIGPELVAVPPPVRRVVRRGDLTDLGIWELVVPAEN